MARPPASRPNLATLPGGSRSAHVERTLAWFARFRRLTVRYERRADILEAFHLLAAALICLRFVERWSY